MGIYLLVFIIGLLYFLFVGGNKNLAKDGRLLAIYFIYLALFVGLGDMIGGYDRYIVNLLILLQILRGEIEIMPMRFIL